MKNNNYEYNGVSFLSILFLVFLVLKLTNVIDWSWWWVTAPLWIPIIIFLCFVGGLYAFYQILKHYNKNKLKNFRKNLKF
jgi:phosphoglycerol transferase MdoB-like AlkP superfamily enzyme